MLKSTGAKGLTSNIDADALKNLIETKENTYMPSPQSALLKNKPDFYIKVLNRVFTLVPNKKHIDELALDFEALINVSPQALCMANIVEAKKLFGSFDSLPTLAGFDMNTLPDNQYLLKLLATQNKLNPIIVNLPPKGIGLNQEWKNLVCQNVLTNILKTGVVQKEHVTNLDNIMDYINDITEAARSYYILKFKMSEFKKRLAAIQKSAQNSELIQSLVSHYKPSKALKDIEKKLQVTEKRGDAEMIMDK